MPFLYPKLFPEFFDCVEETKSNPADIRISGVQFYSTGMPLEKAMALIWKPKTFSVSGTYNYPREQCRDPTGYAYSIWTISNKTTYSLYPPTPQKMSALACNFSANYLVDAFREDYNCEGGIEGTSDDDQGFGFGILRKIYLFNKLYYIPTYYSFANGGNLDGERTQFYGNVTIDGIVFPIYHFDSDGAPISASITITTSAERDPS
jgi:hypothetical protein